MPANKIYLATDASVQEIRDMFDSPIDDINGEVIANGNLGDLTKLAYLRDTKDAIKDAIVSRGIEVPANSTFRSYATKIRSIPSTFDASYDLPDQSSIGLVLSADKSAVRIIWDNVNAVRYTVVRKDNTVPESISDGIIIYDGPMPSQTTETEEINDNTVTTDPYLVKDTTVEMNHTYFYRVYPYNSNGQVQSSRYSSYSSVRIYGTDYKSIYELSLGSKIKFGRFENVEYVWTIIDTLDKRDGVVHVAADRAPFNSQFDAPEPTNPVSNRASYGNNRYSLSNARQFLNSRAAAGEWYTAQHEYDVASSGYSAKAGFLHDFTETELGIIVPRTKTCKLDSNDGGGTETVRDMIWLPNTYDLGLAVTSESTRRFEYFVNNDSRKFNNTNYWTSTQNGSGNYVCSVVSSGTLYNVNRANFNLALRPFCTLNTSTYVVWSDSDQAYVLADAS